MDVLIIEKVGAYFSLPREDMLYVRVNFVHMFITCFAEQSLFMCIKVTCTFCCVLQN